MLQNLHSTIEAIVGAQPRQPDRGFMDRLIRQAEGPPVDGHHVAPLHVFKGLQGILGVTMHLPEGRRSISADRDEGELDGKGPPNLQEAFEIGCIAGEIDMVPVALDDEPPITSVPIVWRASTPVIGWDMDHLEAVTLKVLPPIQLV